VSVQISAKQQSQQWVQLQFEGAPKSKTFFTRRGSHLPLFPPLLWLWWCQKATEQFESSPLKTASLGQGVFIFSGHGGDITAVGNEGSTLLIDSGVDSRVTELSDAIFKATKRPVTRLVNTHWHFDHTGGNVYFGSAGVTIVT
jgi:hypothetical protein